MIAQPAVEIHEHRLGPSPARAVSFWETNIFWSSLLVPKLLPDNANLLPASFSDSPTAPALSWQGHLSPVWQALRRYGRHVMDRLSTHAAGAAAAGFPAGAAGAAAQLAATPQHSWLSLSTPAEGCISGMAAAGVAAGAAGVTAQRVGQCAVHALPDVCQCFKVVLACHLAGRCTPPDTILRPFLGRTTCMTVIRKLAQQALPQGPCWPPCA